MPLIKLGDRGAEVRQVQEALNRRPSTLAPLTADGVFGARTQSRVMEFQRDSGLKADGIVGDLTRARLAEAPNTAAADLMLLVNQLAAQLSPPQRASFVSGVQPLVGPPVFANPGILAGPALEALILLILLMFMAAILVNSQSKANQEAGRALQRKIDSLRDKLRSDPQQAPAVAATALQSAKDEAKKLAERARVEREKCFNNMSPQQRAAKLLACATKIEAVTTAIQSLLQKVGTGIGGGITPESLIKGIEFSAKALIDAMRALGECTGCENLFF